MHIRQGRRHGRTLLLLALGLVVVAALFHGWPQRGHPRPTPTEEPTNTLTPTATSTPTWTPIPFLPVDTRAKECVRVQHWPRTLPQRDTPFPTPTRTPTPSPTPPLLPTPDGVHRTARVPIVMYHHIDALPTNGDRIRYNLTLPPELFEDHLRMLRDEGYAVITLDDLLLYLTRGRPLPPKPVILTFDDGYRDNYTHAFPLLKAYGMTGTFFIINDVVNQSRPEYLTWDMVREMRAAGMRFGAHGRTHIELSQADMDQLVWQALGSTEVFQVELGEPARYIAYPSGRYNERVIQVYKSAHYWAGLTTRQGVIQDSDHLFELKRLRVYPTTTGLQLKYLLEMDWDE